MGGSISNVYRKRCAIYIPSDLSLCFLYRSLFRLQYPTNTIFIVDILVIRCTTAAISTFRQMLQERFACQPSPSKAFPHKMWHIKIYRHRRPSSLASSSVYIPTKFGRSFFLNNILHRSFMCCTYFMYTPMLVRAHT